LARQKVDMSDDLDKKMFDLADRVLNSLAYLAPEDLEMRRTKVVDTLMLAYSEGVRERTEAAARLWQLLDNIDTLDDSCREHDDLFRERTRSQQQKRFEIADSDGYLLNWKRTETKGGME